MARASRSHGRHRRDRGGDSNRDRGGDSNRSRGGDSRYDEEDERPRRRKKSDSGMMPLYFAGGAVLFVIFIALMVLSSSSKPSEENNASNKKKKSATNYNNVPEYTPTPTPGSKPDNPGDIKTRGGVKIVTGSGRSSGGSANIGAAPPSKKWSPLWDLPTDKVVLHYETDTMMGSYKKNLMNYSRSHSVHLLYTHDGDTVTIYRKFVNDHKDNPAAGQKWLHVFIPYKNHQWHAKFGNGRGEVVDTYNMNSEDFKDPERTNVEPISIDFKDIGSGCDALQFSIGSLMALSSKSKLKPPYTMYIFARYDNKKYTFQGGGPNPGKYLDLQMYFNSASNILKVEVK